jgi:hypothetical protein
MFLMGLALSGLWRMAGRYPMQHPSNMMLYVAIIINVLNLPDATSPIVSNIALYLVFGSLIYLREHGRKKAALSRPLTVRSFIITAPNHS